MCKKAQTLGKKVDVPSKYYETITALNRHRNKIKKDECEYIMTNSSTRLRAINELSHYY